MDKIKLKNKLSKDLNRLVRSSLINQFKKASEELQDAIMSEYDDELVDVVTDRNSKTNPNFYRDEFYDRLVRFPYVSDQGDTVTLKVPDMDNFDFSGRLRVIETIMHGTAGRKVEVSEDEYIKIFGKRPINQDPLDKFVRPEDRIYPLMYTSKLRQAERDLGKKFVPFPFSNTPPIRIFDAGDKFVDANMSRWIKEALEEAQKIFAMNYKGARL